jgi:ribosome-associated protein
MTQTSTDSTVKKDVQKLQKAIVGGLEDVKAQDIVVFNTEHLSALFERVMIASGTSNRQTRALAASVRDAVREAGFGKPRIEGEENGEWIIVDCGAAVVHIMQPAIREYYHLEELWGDKPVRLKIGAPKPAQPSAPVAKPVPAKTAAKSGAKGGAKPKAGAAKSPARKSAGAAARPAVKSAPAKSAPAKTARAAAKKPAAGKTAAKTATKKASPRKTA